MRSLSTLAKSAAALGLFAAAALHPIVSAAQSAGVPKLIKIIVPFAPGASTDIFARLLAQKLGGRTGATAVVDNKPGATGAIGAEHVARAPADGSTFMVTATPFAASAAAQPKLPFDPVKSFAPLAMLASGPLVLVVGNDTPYKTTAQLLEVARANRGKLNYGSTGIGSSHHLNTALLNLMANSEMTHVPYKGGGLAVTDLIGGRIQVMLFSYSTVMPHVKGGKIRALAVTTASRSRFAPELPTIAESVPGFSVESWWGAFAPAATPRALVARLNAEIRAVVASPEMREVFDKEGVDAASMTAAEFAAFVYADIEKWRGVARRLNIVAN